ncbi:hypothetical protein D8674_004076 [Pyrus ussuriensis x Pyrus communis]|uniref:Uncharacterized protein n=1 Tax=Pyrus ussuriensis x Pyrus communis TaxID=2448454 RepID=A0A5N5FN21_9ROSA|nr:hypothetical protein D8674_004076 [Pyrus ussuriensis x Pyrus communis]
MWRVVKTSQAQGQIYDQDLSIALLSGAGRSTELKIGERFASSVKVLWRWKFFILPVVGEVKSEGEKGEIDVSHDDSLHTKTVEFEQESKNLGRNQTS